MPLPLPLIPVYLTTWTLLSLVRIHSPKALRTWFSGLREGLTGGWGPRTPLRWRTVLRLTRAGRPPVV